MQEIVTMEQQFLLWIQDYVRCFFRRYTKYKKMIVVRFAGRIFQFQSFMADVPEVTVTAVAVVSGKRQVNSVCLAVCNLCFTGIHFPFITSPGSDDLDIRSKCLDAKLKTDLVISFSGSTVADGNSTFFSCNFN